MHLSNSERRVLATLELAADTPVPQAARRCALRESSFRHAFERLRSQGILRQLIPFLDPWRLGLTQYVVQFSLAASAGARSAFTKYLTAQNAVCWLSEDGSDFQVTACILARTPAELLSLLRGAPQGAFGTMLNKSIAVRTRFVVFPRQYFASSATQTTPVDFGVSNDPVSLDEVDLRICAALGAGPFHNQASLARQLSIAETTLSRRLRSLQQKGILRAFSWDIDLAALGIAKWRIFLRTRSFRPDLAASIYDLCAAHPNIVNFSEFLGDWDFGIDAEVASPPEISRLYDKLTSHLGDVILSSRIVPVFRYYKYSLLPPALLTEQPSAAGTPSEG